MSVGNRSIPAPEGRIPLNISIQTNNLKHLTGFHRSEEVFQRTASSSGNSGSQDRVTLSSTRIPADDGTFARLLASRCAGSICSEASEEKFLQIQAAVTDGTYRPDPARIAEKLLGHS